ncbi:MAG: adenosylcobalamin-dependent ribonucleoside-diphosphate reductase [Candidatus Micrarchaeota archaeon]|nr:adenosylcobalamin-dependent ribonucleoside-diphosphate reductase [Candidatus Micrarchaeota archaeon]MDE1859703.1 adenosylcobalamin-dependent ribonucleoside-diphosphate reductase [Candidatus Micrarchaeota archaeon]
MDDTKEKEKIVENASTMTEVEQITLPKETLEFFKGDEIRARVFFEKYALKDENGKTAETLPKQMWMRVAKAIAEVETTEGKKAEWEEKFRWLLTDFRFLPGGRILFGAGQSRKSTLLNCYVIPVKDDTIEAIFDWCKEAARTYSYGGGVGTDISILRPRNSPVNNSAVVSTGSVSFMNIFSETTHTIGQHGRRGALMITLSVDHPDIMDFIRVKRNLANVRYANISVRITDEFMKAVKEDTEFKLRFQNKTVGKIERTVRARDVWKELVTSARDWAEPGLIFWDSVKRYSPSEYNGMEVISTNPCSEQPLQPYGACDLGNVNLSAFVTNPFSDNAALDWEGLEKTIRYGVRFLDNVLDYNMDKHPLKEQTEAGRNSRRIGIGITGLGDMLVKLKVRYDTDKALAIVDDIFNRMKLISYDESIQIAREKGSFKLFDAQKHLTMPFIQTLPKEVQDKIAQYGLRNVCILTVPPTGSVSVLAGTSSGIEPIFAFSYTRRSESLSQEYFKVYHPLALEYMKLFNVAEENDLPEFFVPAHKIKPEFRVRLQGIIQSHIDSAISSTVNLPRETSVEQVEKIYFQAWEAGCKGITVYREGSREGILITDEQAQKNLNLKKNAAQAEAMSVKEWSRDRILTGQTMRLQMQGAALYVTANFDSTSMREVFINLGKTGSEEKSYTEAMGRLISRYLQLGGSVEDVVSSLKGIKSSSSITWDKGMKLYSVPDAIAKSLELMAGIVNPATAASILKDVKVTSELETGKQASITEKGVTEGAIIKPDKCPSCQEDTLVNENGCFTCMSCSYTKCE